MSCKKQWSEVINKKGRKKLCFIHVPKTGGSYVQILCHDLKIEYIGLHSLPSNHIKNNYITFSILRDPIERVKSMIRFLISLHRNGHRDVFRTWPKRLSNELDSCNDINKLIYKLTDDELKKICILLGITYKQYYDNSDIIITIDQLPSLLNYFDYEYNVYDYPKRYESTVNLGELNDISKKRLINLFIDDVITYHNILNKMYKSLEPNLNVKYENDLGMRKNITIEQVKAKKYNNDSCIYNIENRP